MQAKAALGEPHNGKRHITLYKNNKFIEFTFDGSVWDFYLRSLINITCLTAATTVVAAIDWLRHQPLLQRKGATTIATHSNIARSSLSFSE